MSACPGEVPGRLRWLCRRGMLELDAWLEPFLETRYITLDQAGQEAFARLLELDDFQLYDLLTRASEPTPALRGIVAELLSTHRPHL